MLISDKYRSEQTRLHGTGSYGVAALAYGETVSQLVEMMQAKTLLDYGCGSKRSLAKVLNCDVIYQGYDPAVEDYSQDPDPADLVVCIDVLEHIEPECLDAVLDHLKSKMLRMAFLTIHCGPAHKILKDGRNAHLIQEGAKWWLPKLLERWELVKFQKSKHGFTVLLQ